MAGSAPSDVTVGACEFCEHALSTLMISNTIAVTMTFGPRSRRYCRLDRVMCFSLPSLC